MLLSCFKVYNNIINNNTRWGGERTEVVTTFSFPLISCGVLTPLLRHVSTAVQPPDSCRPTKKTGPPTLGRTCVRCSEAESTCRAPSPSFSSLSAGSWVLIAYSFRDHREAARKAGHVPVNRPPHLVIIARLPLMGKRVEYVENTLFLWTWLANGYLRAARVPHWTAD